jgi:hypothetical protein
MARSVANREGGVVSAAFAFHNAHFQWMEIMKMLQNVTHVVSVQMQMIAKVEASLYHLHNQQYKRNVKSSVREKSFM